MLFDMRLVIQRVTDASVSVGGKTVSSISHGLFILVGVERGDTAEDVRWLSSKVAGMRIFNDVEGVMNRNVAEVEGGILAVSQFTLTASTRKGNRPSYIRAAGHELAVPMYDGFCRMLGDATGHPVLKGVFGADMKCSLTNDGPVTIVIDSRLRE